MSDATQAADAVAGPPGASGDEAEAPAPEGDELPSRLHRTWPQRLLLCCCLLASCTSFLAAGFVHIVHDKASRVQRIALSNVLVPVGVTVARPTASSVAAPTTTAPPPEPPVNIVVVGIDNADGLAPGDRRRIGRDGGLRSDTIMVLRLEPDPGRAALLSLPRDLWLPLGGDGPNDRLNAALPLGGPELLIRTISQNFAIPVHHFVQVDFAQFEALVDAIDGVPFPFAYPVRDDNSGLYVGEAGCVVLDGAAALDYVRSRYLKRLVDGEWEADPSADLSRIRRQQDFLRRAFARAKDRGLSNPLTANALIDAGIAAITVDEGFSSADIVELAVRFRSLDPAALPTFSLPVSPDTTSGGASILRLRPAGAEPVLDLFRGLDPFSPAAAPVGLEAGSEELAAGLRAAGFPVTPAATATSGAATSEAATTGATSEIRFATEDRYRAELLASWLEGPLTLVEGDREPTGMVTLVAGGPLRVRSSPPATAPAWTRAATPSEGFLPSDDALAC
jgi:LCP family protein required for cell wall assembly